MSKRKKVSVRDMVLVLVVLSALSLVVMLVSGMEHVQHEEQTQFVIDAVRKAALTCYAVQGAYPDNLEYLRQEYGLAYDDNRYVVTYDAFASNQLPDIFVVVREGDE